MPLLPAFLRKSAQFLPAVPILFLMSCAGVQEEPWPEVVFPAPPDAARIQYIASISSSDDLEVTERSGFAKFILGTVPAADRLKKPINTAFFDNKLYVCDTVQREIIVFDLASGSSHTLKGNRRKGRLQRPVNVSVDAQGKIYVPDAGRKGVMVYGPDEVFERALGRPEEAEPVFARARDGRVYVCDRKDHEVEVWDSDGNLLQTLGGTAGEEGNLAFPTYIDIDGEGSIYVTDTGHHRVVKYTPDGEFDTVFGRHGNTPGSFSWPKGMVVDDYGRVFVADSRFFTVQIFDDQQNLLMFFGGPTLEEGNLKLPAGLCIAPWPEDVPWLNDRVIDGLNPEYMIIVTCQFRSNFLNLFALTKNKEIEDVEEMEDVVEEVVEEDTDSDPEGQ